MYNLFSNTGIQFFELPWAIQEETIQTVFSKELNRFISNNWTLLSLDGTARDYARLFWRKEEASSIGVRLRPVLAVDTKTEGMDSNRGFLKEVDAGRTFKSKSIDLVIPEKAEKIHRNWINYICNEKAIVSEGIYDSYRQLIQNLIEGQYIDKNTQANEDMRRYGFLGGFDFLLFEENDQCIDTNLYIDLGNSRTTAIVYEDHALSAAGFNTFTKIELINYKEYFGNRDQASVTVHESVFPSLIQFRKPPIPSIDTINDTFKLLSIAAIGEEARLYKTLEDVRPVSSFTGLSSPKRYLWDNEPFAANWQFAERPGEQISGEVLKHISLDDIDDEEGVLMRMPVDTNYPRRTIVIHFFIELLEQALRAINSYKQRKNALPDQPRVLNRIVISYPTAFSPQLTERYLKQVRKAVRIIQEQYTLSKNLTVDLGIDEASTVQCVFIQNHIFHSENSFFKKLIQHQTYHNDKNKLRIASIDIGGGTTDVMVSEFDLTNINTGAPIEGQLLFSDGIQYGGDEIVQKLISDLIFPKMTANFDNQLIIQKIGDILQGDSSDKKHLRLGLINCLFYPLAIYILHRSAKKQSNANNLLDEIPDETLYNITQEILPKLGASSLSKGVPEIINALDVYETGLGEQFFKGSKISLVISLADVKTLIQSTSLIETYLNHYAKIFSHYSPTFILLAGKLSELDIIEESLKYSLCFSPERVIPISKIKIGQWYPYRIGYNMEDAKTTVCVGLAIADITKHAINTNGLAVKIKNSDMLFANKRYYIKSNPTLNLSEDNLLLDTDQEVSDTFHLFGNRHYIFGSRTHIYPTKPPINFGSMHYELQLKKSFLPFDSDLPRMKVKRTMNGIEIDPGSISGKVHRINSEPENCTEDHIRLVPKNIHEDFYLDSGRLF